MKQVFRWNLSNLTLKHTLGKLPLFHSKLSTLCQAHTSWISSRFICAHSTSQLHLKSIRRETCRHRTDTGPFWSETVTEILLVSSGPVVPSSLFPSLLSGRRSLTHQLNLCKRRETLRYTTEFPRHLSVWPNCDSSQDWIKGLNNCGKPMGCRRKRG